MKVTFCGHGDTVISNELREWLHQTILAQIEAGADLFYLGGYGSFDRAAAAAVWEIKKTFPGIMSILVLPYPDQKTDTTYYDSTVYPPLENVPRRYAILRRNRWMAEVSDVVIACVEHEWGGAARTLQYAMAKKKTVINYAAWEPSCRTLTK